MGQKICPLSFFNFYVNKEAAQAGGCHMCVEENCALWDEHFEQCSLKSGIEAISNIADHFTDTAPEAKKIASPISGVLERIKLKKKVQEPSIVSQLISQPPAAPPPPPPPVPDTNVTIIPAAVTIIPNVETTPAAAPITPIADTSKTTDVTNPPDVPVSDLPIISINEPPSQVEW